MEELSKSQRDLADTATTLRGERRGKAKEDGARRVLGVLRLWGHRRLAQGWRAWCNHDQGVTVAASRNAAWEEANAAMKREWAEEAAEEARVAAESARANAESIARRQLREMNDRNRETMDMAGEDQLAWRVRTVQTVGDMVERIAAAAVEEAQAALHAFEAEAEAEAGTTAAGLSSPVVAAQRASSVHGAIANALPQGQEAAADAQVKQGKLSRWAGGHAQAGAPARREVSTAIHAWTISFVTPCKLLHVCAASLYVSFRC